MRKLKLSVTNFELSVTKMPNIFTNSSKIRVFKLHVQNNYTGWPQPHGAHGGHGRHMESNWCTWSTWSTWTAHGLRNFRFFPGLYLCFHFMRTFLTTSILGLLRAQMIAENVLIQLCTIMRPNFVSMGQKLG